MSPSIYYKYKNILYDVCISTSNMLYYTNDLSREEGLLLRRLEGGRSIQFARDK